MDPASIIGIAGSILSISDVIARSVKGLLAIQTAYKSAHLQLTLIIGHLTTVRAALNEIENWLSGSQQSHKRLCSDIQRAVQSCEIIVLALDERVQSVQSSRDLSIKAKIAFALEEGGIKIFSNHLGNQVHALNLLLTAAHCRTNEERNALLEDREARQAFRQIEEDSSSYVRSERVASRQPSIMPGTSAGLDTDFEFDFQIINSDVYRRALRSAMKTSKKHESQDQTGQTKNELEPRVLVTSGEPTQLDGANPTASKDGKQTTRNAQIQEDADLSSQRDIVSSVPPKEREDQNSGIVPVPKPNSQQKDRSRYRNPFAFFFKRDAKTLILGASESGKSTLLKAMKLFYEGGYTYDEAESFKEIIFSNMIESMQVVLGAMEIFEIPLQHRRNDFHAQTIFMQPNRYEKECLAPEIVSAIEALSTDSGVLESLARRAEYQLNDNVDYYFSNVRRIGSLSYTPSVADVQWSRVKTTGITETLHEYNGTRRRIFDHGGVRSERTLWIHSFENVHSIIFTVDSGCYDQLLFEDETVNRMQESMTLFDSIVNARWFIRTHMILLFTKLDKLKKKLLLHPINPYYAMPTRLANLSLKEAKAYLAYSFCTLNEASKGMTIIFSSTFEGRNPASMVYQALSQLARNVPDAQIHIQDGTESSESPDLIVSWDQILGNMKELGLMKQ